MIVKRNNLIIMIVNWNNLIIILSHNCDFFILFSMALMSFHIYHLWDPIIKIKKRNEKHLLIGLIGINLPTVLQTATTHKRLKHVWVNFLQRAVWGQIQRTGTLGNRRCKEQGTLFPWANIHIDLNATGSCGWFTKNHDTKIEGASN